MRKLLYIFPIFLLCVACRAGSLITATITVTNSPADGDTITVNSDTRTWKNTVTASTTQIAITSGAAANTTNMWNQFAANRFTTLTPSFVATNQIALRGIVGQTLTLSISGTWGYYTLTTNTTAEGDSVRVPASSYQTASKATNIMGQLALDLGTYSSNALANGTKLLEGIVQTNQTQTINGTKTFTGANIHSNASQQFVGGTITGASLSGITNAAITNLNVFGQLNVTNTSPSIWYADSDAAADNQIAELLLINGDFAIRFWDDAVSSGQYGMAIDRTGTAITRVLLPNGDIYIGGGLTAPTSNGLTVDGYTKLLKSDSSSLSSGNNAAVDLGNKTFLKISSGPSAAFAICGIAGGSDGKMVIIYNATTYNMTIANDSGVDPTAANRIYTNTGADVATTGNGAATLIYDSGASRWILVSIQQ